MASGELSDGNPPTPTGGPRRSCPRESRCPRGDTAWCSTPEPGFRARASKRSFPRWKWNSRCVTPAGRTTCRSCSVLTGTPPAGGGEVSARLTSNASGKAAIRLVKLVREESRLRIHDCRVQVRLEGRFESAHTEGINTDVLPTDTMKNTVFALARDATLDEPERCAHMEIGRASRRGGGRHRGGDREGEGRRIKRAR